MLMQLPRCFDGGTDCHASIAGPVFYPSSRHAPGAAVPLVQCAFLPRRDSVATARSSGVRVSWESRYLVLGVEALVLVKLVKENRVGAEGPRVWLRWIHATHRRQWRPSTTARHQFPYRTWVKTSFTATRRKVGRWLDYLSIIKWVVITFSSDMIYNEKIYWELFFNNY